MEDSMLLNEGRNEVNTSLFVSDNSNLRLSKVSSMQIFYKSAAEELPIYSIKNKSSWGP